MGEMVVETLDIRFREERSESAIAWVVRCCNSALGLFWHEKLIQDSEAHQRRFDAGVGKNGLLHRVQLELGLENAPIDGRDGLVDRVANMHQAVLKFATRSTHGPDVQALSDRRWQRRGFCRKRPAHCGPVYII